MVVFFLVVLYLCMGFINRLELNDFWVDWFFILVEVDLDFMFILLYGCFFVFIGLLDIVLRILCNYWYYRINLLLMLLNFNKKIYKIKNFIINWLR